MARSPPSKRPRLNHTLMQGIKLDSADLESYLEEINDLEHCDPKELGTNILEYLLGKGVPLGVSRDTSNLIERNLTNFQQPPIICQLSNSELVDELIKLFRGSKKQRIKGVLESIGSNLATKDRGELWESLKNKKVEDSDAQKILDKLEPLKHLELRKEDFKDFCDTTRKRVFYFMDFKLMRREIPIHANDTSQPVKFRLPFVDSCLKPNFIYSTNISLNEGCYVRVAKDVYFYEFPHTTGASAATVASLEIPDSMIFTEPNAEKIIPPCQIMEFTKFVVPQSFFGEPDVLVVMQISREEGRQEGLEEAKRILKLGGAPEEVLKLLDTSNLSEDDQLNTVPEDDPEALIDPSQFQAGLNISSQETVPSLSSIYEQAKIRRKFEVARNEVFVQWLQKNIRNLPNSEDFLIKSDQAGKNKYCRFARSKEDFTCSITCKNRGISVTVEQHDMDEEELMGISGDCKNLAEDRNEPQVLANMLKTACDLVVEFVNVYEKTPSKVIVFGVLVDYKSICVVKAYKLILDFISLKSSLMKCADSEIEVHKAFSSMVNIISNH